MMESTHSRDIVRLGPRIPVANVKPRAMGEMDAIMNIAIPTRIIEARQDSTTSGSAATSTNAHAGDLPVSSSTFTLPIVLGIAIPVIGAGILFMILQRRHNRKQREEDANDRHASMDFGLGDVPQPGRKKNGGTRTIATMDYSEKPEGSGASRRQVSMDMSVNQPYLLPPEMQNSRESLHSLSRTMDEDDPYGPVTQYFPGDSASIRTQSKQGSSIYTASTGRAPSRMQENLLSNAARMSQSGPPMGFVPPPRNNSLAPREITPSSPLNTEPMTPYPVEPAQVHLPEPTLPNLPRKAVPAPTAGLAPQFPDGRESFASNGEGAAMRQSNNYLGAFISSGDQEPSSNQETRKSPPQLQSTPGSIPHSQQKSVPDVPLEDYHGYSGVIEDADGFQVTPPSPSHDRRAEPMRSQRYSMDVPPEEFAKAGLGAPDFNANRLSMGFRPLPPTAVVEHDDPEIRANRIRSFYKEYFDDSKPDPQGQYHEDVEENYLGDAAYFDPDTNQFVMPYAEPVTRRAMTPPPRGAPRFQGNPRPRQGSMGAVSVGGGPRGPPRYPPGGPRAHSSASGRQGPKKPMAPPAPLLTLPTPSKLRDDSSFDMLNTIDFAPPLTPRDRVAGRSESPFGERRPYSPGVPAFKPIVSAFDELAPIPSAHSLRNSGTFTSLDFAAPRRIRDPENMSDSGSIKSNKSGISSRQLGAIRNGAYRVSRLPKEAVGSKDELTSALKPTWDMIR